MTIQELLDYVNEVLSREDHREKEVVDTMPYKDKEKEKAHNKEYYRKNKAKRNKASIEWKSLNIERSREIDRKSYQKNKEKIKAYRERNKEKIKEVQKVWRENNVEYLAMKHKVWRDKNLEYSKEYNRRYLRENYRDFYKKSKDKGQRQAVSAVALAVKRGDLIKLSELFIKCSDCDNRAVQYDHRDYNKPLEVDPVCRSCNIKRGPAIPKIVDSLRGEELE